MKPIGRSYEVLFPMHVFKGQTEYCIAHGKSTVAEICRRDGIRMPKPLGQPVTSIEGDDVILRWTWVEADE